MLVIVRGVFRLFRSVAVLVGLVDPTPTLPNPSVEGESVAWGTPVPVRFMICGLPVALSAMEMELLKVPVAMGLNVTVIVQWALGRSEPGQALDS